ncbi:polycystic kidney disease protein 1-like 2 [Elysia marginata]|uniref:Polycystic kidney disease protein 1-like 2 n=1 Tax=Elysia marginata TaxID=1093978 RepID=A0AAV4GBY3_9GAST|nr:polycystic kidney disease protein 1-like 2 [Elysia marginata]
MAVPSSLGDLETLRIWHDMSGRGRNACWFLDRVDVVELRSGYAWHFLCGEWLTPEDNSTDKILQACSPEDLETLRSAFFTKVKERATDDHIWVSVFIRPERSRFSRVERVWTCLCFLVLAMLTSAMFYQGAADVDRKQAQPGLTLGPFGFSYQQLYFSLIGAVISSLPITIIVFLFRKARMRSDMDGAWWCAKRHKAMGSYRANMDFVDELIMSENGHKKYVGKEKGGLYALVR